MLTSRRIEELDRYFYRDHSARKRHLIYVSVVSGIVLVLCKQHRFSDIETLLSVGFSVTFVYAVLIAKYRQPNLSRRELKLIERSQPEFRDFLYSRRSLLYGVGILVAFGSLIFRTPDLEGEIVNGRLRRLLHAGKDLQAAKEAGDAIGSGLALEPDVIRAVGQPRSFGGTVYSVRPVDGIVRPVDVDLGNGVKITVCDVVVILAAGDNPTAKSHDEMHYPVNTTGYGPNLTRLTPYFRDNAVFRHVLNNYDLLLYGFAFKRNSKGYSELPTNAPGSDYQALLTVGTGASRVAVVNVELDSLRQALDGAIWVDARFKNCTIVLSGRGFRLMRAAFENCTFEPNQNVSASVVAQMKNSQGRPVTLNY